RTGLSFHHTSSHTTISTLSLHDALPICGSPCGEDHVTWPSPMPARPDRMARPTPTAALASLAVSLAWVNRATAPAANAANQARPYTPSTGAQGAKTPSTWAYPMF